MRESSENLWRIDAQVRVITTNGFVKRNGEAVLGAGCAKEAVALDPELPALLGGLLAQYGNVVHQLRARPGRAELWSFPVKHHWMEEADLDLILRSTRDMVALADHQGYERVALPRPGCGNGRLSWTDVRPHIEPWLDDRFTVVHIPARRR